MCTWLELHDCKRIYPLLESRLLFFFHYFSLVHPKRYFEGYKYIAAFWPNHPKSVQNMWFTPQSKTTIIPDLFKVGVSPRDNHTDVATEKPLLLLLIVNNRLSCFYCIWTPRPLNNLPGVIEYPSYYTGNNFKNCVDEWLPGGVCDFNTDNPCVFHAVDFQISFSHIPESIGNAWQPFIGRRPLFDHLIFITVRQLSVSQTGFYQKSLDFLLNSSVVSRRLDFSIVSIRRLDNWKENSPSLLSLSPSVNIRAPLGKGNVDPSVYHTI